MNETRIKEILAYYDSIETLANNWVKKPHIAERELKRGLTVSKQATVHPTEVPMTPIMKNMLRAFGDIAEGERLLTGAPTTKAEKWLDQVVETILLQQSGKKSESYNTGLPICDIRHYWTQCWMNWNPDKFRDIGKGQVEEINSVIDIYAKPTKAIDIRSMMRTDSVFNKAIEVVCDSLPSVSATRNIVEVNLPFQTKHTNVGYVPGYEGFGNDRSKVKGTNLTYAQLTMKIAATLKDKPEELWKFNVSEEFSRYQRLKGRLIIAVSRIIALVLNQLESIEIQNYKVKSPLFAGYNDATHLKSVMDSMAKFAEQNGFVTYNIDYHRFDQHLCKQLIILVGAISVYKCADARSKKLAMYRAALMTKSWLIAGTKEQEGLIEIFGRIFSGFIDTNRAGGCVNALSMIHLLMKQDPHYVRDIVSRTYHYMLVMGDDNLLIANPANFSLTRLQTDAEKIFGHEIDDASKIAFGVTFLQYRLFNYQDKRIMVYAWPRVLRSALMKERSGHLGPCGWTLAWWQQLAKLIDFDHPDVVEFVKPVVNILAYFDDNGLMLDRELKDIFEGIKQEDDEAIKNNKRSVTTAEALYDGDPSKAQQYSVSSDGKVTLSLNYFERVRQVLKSAYDPNYFRNLSIGVPAKAKVK